MPCVHTDSMCGYDMLEVEKDVSNMRTWELRVDMARYHHPVVLPFLRIKATLPFSS